MLEKGNVKATKLSKVVSRDEVEEDDLGDMYVKPDGTMVIRKLTKAEVKTPANPEELRHRLKLEGTSWEFARLKLPHEPQLKELEAAVWRDHLDYALGEKVYGARCNSETGEDTHRPSRILVLECEFQFRKQAADLVNIGNISIKAALEAARKDREVHQECFSTPLAIAAGQAAANASLDGTSLLDSRASIVQRTVRKGTGKQTLPGFRGGIVRTKGRRPASCTEEVWKQRWQEQRQGQRKRQRRWQESSSSSSRRRAAAQEASHREGALLRASCREVH